MKILVVDDDPDITELLSIYLKNEDFEPLTAATGPQALKCLASDHQIALMILDLMLPGMSGNEVLKRVRQRSRIPILIVSAKTDDLDKIQGLVTGADDYVVKPFNPLEVVVRVKSLLRRANPQMLTAAPDKLAVGPLLIDKRSHEVLTTQQQRVQLTALEFNILYLLASHPNQVFSADEIFQRVWKQDSAISTKTVMVHVSHLRDKLEAATDGEKVIETVWGVGYKVEA
ncbi:response regulator transcription factor [Bombilactobacillus mellifer]|uniref:response regulator transcription factor n=1 Tax=Bombilactobacillus mellifer TaxID=1218492 RepID=UPI00061AC119|nr:response regulator transcription factor [Bombilactobacillus mellifer]